MILEISILAIATLIFVWLCMDRTRKQKRFNQEIQGVKMIHHEALEAERKRHELLLDGLSDALFLVDQSGMVCYANIAARNMFAERNVVGQSPQAVFPDARFIEAIQQCEKTCQPVVQRLVLPQQLSPLGSRENRGVNAWLLDVAPLAPEAYPEAKLRILLRDLTAEFQSEQVRKDFVANASHELRTPLAIIQGYLENLLEAGALRDHQQAARFLGIMSKHTDRVSRIVEDMLVISRLESGEAAALSIEPFEFHSCVQDVHERLEHLIVSQQASVDYTEVERGLMITGDRFYWTQVLFNLIENALKQNPRPGLRVVVTGAQNGDSIHISVADDGIGIPSSHLPFVFKRFYRVDQNHTNSAIKGTGLGLSIVKRAIEAHGGTISVSSVPGRETKFSIVLPTSHDASTAIPSATS
ncbi:MAG: ATP-binding protein [Akkermansiaceae bacterium]|jgi:two-component system phosphate regulon sensor histidine kinase PhoR